MRQYPAAVAVQAPVKGQVIWQYDIDSNAPVAGSEPEVGKPVAYIQDLLWHRTCSGCHNRTYRGSMLPPGR